MEPKFKIGNKIKRKGDTRLTTIKDIRDDCYIITFPDLFGHAYITDKLLFSNQNEYELVSDKFDILLKDLCARLPYGVKICYIYNEEECVSTIEKIDTFGYIWDNYNGCYHVREIKPYLFPMSSMTEEQKKEFDQLIELELKAISDEIGPTQATAFEIDFYNRHHFDWRGLIPMGLANDATNLNIY